MEIRKKEITELEEKNRRALASIDRQLEILGKNLLTRYKDANPQEIPLFLPPKPEEFSQLLGEMDGIAEQIDGVEKDIARLEGIEGEIRQKETDNSEVAKAASALRVQLGESLLNDPAFEEFAQPYQESLSSLLPKAKSLEDRLELMGDQSSGNMLFRIGKNAQAIVLKPQLAKVRADLQRIYGRAGEQYLHEYGGQAAPAGQAGDLFQELEDFKAMEEEIASNLSALNELRDGILSSFKPEGNGKKKIQSLEHRTRQINEQFLLLYANYGKQAEQSIREDPAGKAGELETLTTLDELRESIRDNSEQIEKLNASLAIDEERAKIDRMEKLIRENKERIEAAESLIEELTLSIQESKSRIEDLSDRIHGGKTV